MDAQPALPQNDKLAARAFLLNALRSLRADDRELACDCVLAERGPDYEPLGEVARLFVRPIVELMRHDSKLARDVFAKHIRDEARDWVLWSACFGVAQGEIEACYRDLRNRTRWNDQEWMSHLITQDERPILRHLCEVLERNMQALQSLPPIFRIQIYCFIGLYLLFWLAVWIFGRKRIPAAVVAETKLWTLRVYSRKWILTWEALLCVGPRMLDDEGLYEQRSQHLDLILDKLDRRFPTSSTAIDHTTVFDTLNIGSLPLLDRDALAEDIVARIRPFVESASLTHQSQPTEDDERAQRAQRARLDVLISDACDDLGIQDELFRFLSRAEYESHSRQLAFRQYESYMLSHAIDQVLQALKELTSEKGPVPATLGPWVDNVHARIAWIGGLGRAQTDIHTQLGMLRKAPNRQQLQRVHDVVARHLRALRTSVASFADLFAAPRGRRLKLILTEVLECFAHDFALLVYPFFPTVVGADGMYNIIFVIACAMTLRWTTEEYSSQALQGLGHYAHGYRDHDEVNRVSEALARVEFYACYHLVNWQAMQNTIRTVLETDRPEGDTMLDGVTALLVKVSARAGARQISNALDWAMDSRCGWLRKEPYARADVVRRMIEEHYPYYQDEADLREHKRVDGSSQTSMEAKS